MTVEEKISKLKEYGSTKKELRRLEEEKRDILAGGLNIVSVLNNMPRGNSVTDKVGNTSVELEMIDDKIRIVAKKLKEQREIIDYEISLLQDEVQKDVIFKKYIMLWSYTSIAENMGVSKRTVVRLHAKGIKNMLN